jgi:ABC-type proline/glycine betaine transport system ATPase subunit
MLNNYVKNPADPYGGKYTKRVNSNLMFHQGQVKRKVPGQISHSHSLAAYGMEKQQRQLNSQQGENTSLVMKQLSRQQTNPVLKSASNDVIMRAKLGPGHRRGSNH